MATKTEFGGVGVCLADEESSALELGTERAWLTLLAERAGVEVVSSSAADAFGYDEDRDAAIADASPLALDGDDWAYALNMLPDDASRDAAHEAVGAQMRLENRASYRKETGRRLPRVYRLRVTLEAEELGDDEAAAWWARQRAANAARDAERAGQAEPSP